MVFLKDFMYLCICVFIYLCRPNEWMGAGREVEGEGQADSTQIMEPMWSSIPQP